MPTNDHNKKLGRLLNRQSNGVVNSCRSSERKKKSCVFGKRENMYKSHDTLAKYGKMGRIWRDGEEDSRQRARGTT